MKSNIIYSNADCDLCYAVRGTILPANGPLNRIFALSVFDQYVTLLTVIVIGAQTACITVSTPCLSGSRCDREKSQAEQRNPAKGLEVNGSLPHPQCRYEGRFLPGAFRHQMVFV